MKQNFKFSLDKPIIKCELLSDNDIAPINIFLNSNKISSLSEANANKENPSSVCKYSGDKSISSNFDYYHHIGKYENLIYVQDKLYDRKSIYDLIKSNFYQNRYNNELELSNYNKRIKKVTKETIPLIEEYSKNKKTNSNKNKNKILPILAIDNGRIIDEKISVFKHIYNNLFNKLELFGYNNNNSNL